MTPIGGIYGIPALAQQGQQNSAAMLELRFRELWAQQLGLKQQMGQIYQQLAQLNTQIVNTRMGIAPHYNAMSMAEPPRISQAQAQEIIAQAQEQMEPLKQQYRQLEQEVRKIDVEMERVRIKMNQQQHPQGYPMPQGDGVNYQTPIPSRLTNGGGYVPYAPSARGGKNLAQIEAEIYKYENMLRDVERNYRRLSRTNPLSSILHSYGQQMADIQRKLNALYEERAQIPY